MRLFAILLLMAPRLFGEAGLTLAEAVEATLARHPDLEIQRQAVAIARSVRQEAAAPFDTVFSAAMSQDRLTSPLTSRSQANAAAQGFSALTQTSNTTQFSAGAARLLRSGASVSITAESTRATDNLQNQIALGANRAVTAVRLTLPLMAGRGRDIVTAPETAAAMEVDARFLELNHAAAQLVLNTVTAYWRLVGAKKRLQVSIESEERGAKLRDNLSELIAADQAPRSDIYNVFANLAGRAASRTAAEQAVTDAAKELALAMGLGTQMFGNLPDATDEFPDGGGVPAPGVSAEILKQMVEEALRRRADILGARQRERATEVKGKVARNLFKPRLDVNASLEYSGLREGIAIDRYVGAMLLGGRGPDVRLGISYAAPQNRLLAQARTLEAQAELRQSMLRTRNLEREAAGEVVQALHALENASTMLRHAREAVRYSEEALLGQREKLQLGLGSVIELLTVEDRLTSAHEQLVTAQLEVPLAIIRLRFATGTLVPADQRLGKIDADRFTSPPFGVAP